MWNNDYQGSALSLYFMYFGDLWLFTWMGLLSLSASIDTLAMFASSLPFSLIIEGHYMKNKLKSDILKLKYLKQKNKRIVNH